MTNDGTCTFIIDDIRDMTRVGAVTASLYIPAGYVLADGSTKNRADYPRLVNLIEKYNLWKDDTTNDLGKYGKGDNSTTFVLPNLIDRHIKYANSAGKKLEAGLPNITGGFRGIYTNGSVDSTFYGAISSGSAGGVLLGNAASANFVDCAVNFNARISSAVYGNSTTVQPPSIQYLPIIRY